MVGGDDAKRGLRIEVVDSPAIVNMEIQCEYPPYTGRPAKTVQVTGVMQFPWGSKLTVRATSNKDLEAVTVEPQQEPGPRKPAEKPAPVTLPLAAGNPRSFEHTIESLTKETTLLFTLHDTDGVRSREPVQLILSAVEDEKPRISARLQAIGTAEAIIAPRAMLPVKGQVTDDYGIARIWFEHVVDDDPAGNREIATLAGNATEYALDPSKAVFDAADLGLIPGQKLSASVKAADRFDLGTSPNVGSSDRWVLKVVTEQQLQIALKAKQLTLRPQYEELVKKVEYTRTTVASLDFSPKLAPGDNTGGAAGAAKKPEPAGELPAGKAASKGDGPAAAPETGAQARCRRRGSGRCRAGESADARSAVGRRK